MNTPNQESSTWKKQIDKLWQKVCSESFWEKVFSIIIIFFSVIAIPYFIFIICFYIKSHPNPWVLWGDIHYEAFSHFGTHVAGIAAIFAFILVFATYRQQIKANKEQGEYIKNKENQQIAANLKQDEYISRKEAQLTEQAKTIKQLVNDNKKQSISQINQLKTLATHIDTMVGNNQNQYTSAIKEKGFYFLLQHFDTTISKFILLKMKRLEEIQDTILTSHEIMGRQALNTIYDDFINSLNSNTDQRDLIERVYKISPLFLNEYFNQIRMILEKVSEFPNSSIYIKIFQYMLSDEEKGLILYILLYMEEIPKRKHLIKLIEQYNILEDFPVEKLIDKGDVKNLFAIIQE